MRGFPSHNLQQTTCSAEIDVTETHCQVDLLMIQYNFQTDSHVAQIKCTELFGCVGLHQLLYYIIRLKLLLVWYRMQNKDFLKDGLENLVNILIHINLYKETRMHTHMYIRKYTFGALRCGVCLEMYVTGDECITYHIACKTRGGGRFQHTYMQVHNTRAHVCVYTGECVHVHKCTCTKSLHRWKYVCILLTKRHTLSSALTKCL